jgi:hypothetical protein
MAENNWDACKIPDYLLWVLRKIGAPERDLRLIAVRMAKETPTPDGRLLLELLSDERSLKALEVAEKYANGEATEEELEKARKEASSAAEEIWKLFEAACTKAHPTWDEECASTMEVWGAASIAALTAWNSAQKASQLVVDFSGWKVAEEAQARIIREIFPWSRVQAMIEGWAINEKKRIFDQAKEVFG